jgi:hypothetical protein
MEQVIIDNLIKEKRMELLGMVKEDCYRLLDVIDNAKLSNKSNINYTSALDRITKSSMRVLDFNATVMNFFEPETADYAEKV